MSDTPDVDAFVNRLHDADLSWYDNSAQTLEFAQKQERTNTALAADLRAAREAVDGLVQNCDSMKQTHDAILAKLAETERERDRYRNPDIELSEVTKLFNGGVQCDMLFGACACGATHKLEDTELRFKQIHDAAIKGVEIYVRKLDATQQERDQLRAALAKCEGERDALLAKERPDQTTPQGLIYRYHNDRVFHELVDQLALTKFLPERDRIASEMDDMATDRDRLRAVVEADAEVYAEIDRAVAKFPTWPTDALHALAVLGEEFGELTKEVVQRTYEPHKSLPSDVRKEAIQTAAMAIRFLRSLERYDFTPREQHQQTKALAALTASVKEGK